MADPREFVLIGSFTDGITPSLEKINDSINTLKQSLNAFGSKKGGFNDLTKSMGKVVSAHINLKEQVKELRQEMRDSLPVLREYRREVGKAVSANMHMAGGKRFIKKSNPYLQFLDQAKKQTDELAKASQNVQLGRRMPRATGGGGGGGGARPPRTPSFPTGGGGGYVPSSRSTSTFGTKKFGVSRDETFAFGQTLGFTLGSTITGAIVQGFQIGVGLMVKPFQMFAGALQERVQDELSDISAAGGLLSVAKRQQGNPLVKSFQDSMDLTQATNKYMAEIAAALPGNTQQYIEVGKRMSDTAARMISADPAKAIAYAQELAAKEGKGRIVETQKQAYTQIIGNMATQGVLAGLGDGGGGAGARGVMGAYGLPQLMERMMNDQEVTMGQFQRYAAIFRDPKIMDALERFIPKINATMKGTVDRARVFDKFFEEVLPPEMIRAFERSSAGIMEAFRTAFIGPETGLFGLGRKFENMGKKMDAYGRYLDEKGEVTDFKNAADAALSLFDMLRDIFANISIALYPLIDILPQIFDPLKNIGDLLVDARHISGQFLQSFESYLAGLEDLAKTTKKGDQDFAKTKRARAGLLAISNFLTDIGAFSEDQFKSLRLDILNKPSAELGDVLNQILKTFFESKAAYDIGNLIGGIIGTTLKQVATMIEYFLGIAQTSQLASGLKTGFMKAGGYEAVQSIMRNIFKALIKGLYEIFKLAPLEFSVIGAAALLIPAFTSAFSIMVANWLEGFLEKSLGILGNKLKGDALKPGFFEKARQAYLFDKAKGAVDAGKAVTRQGTVASPSGVLGAKRIENKLFPGVALGMDPAMSIGAPSKAPSIPKPVASAKGAPVRILSVAKNAFTGAKGFAQQAGGFLGGLYGKMGAGGMAGLKNPIGMLGKFGSVLTVVTGALSGIATFLQTGDIFKALGAAAGPVLGTILGTAILGPIGGMIGAWLFSQEGAVNSLASIFESVSQSLGGILTVLGEFGSAILQATGALFGAKSEGQALQQIFVLLKMALFPLTATLQLAEMGLRALYIAFLQIDKWVNATFQGGDRQGRIQTAIDKAQNDQMRRLMENQEYYASWSRREGQTGTLNGKSVTWEGGQWTDSTTGKPAAGAPPPKPSPVFNPSGTPAPGAPAGSPAAIPEEVKQTAQNTLDLNTKAATQVTQGVNIQKATEETKKNTTSANVTLGNIKAGLMTISNKLTGIQNAMLGDLNNIQAGVTSISSLLSSGSLKVTAQGVGPMGGPMGNASGNLGAAQSLASQYGLSMTSWFRPGDPGYHGKGRAMDFSNGVSTPQQMAFAQALASQYGTSIKQLIYTPLGYGISDGTVVPLSYWGAATNAAHYNHVHVAFAEGFNKGRMFTSQSAAVGWENSMVPGSVKVASITGNSSEGFGTGANVVNNITINQQPGQDADELASLVAFKISEAVSDARAASLFV